jgi:hypothetical protein
MRTKLSGKAPERKEERRVVRMQAINRDEVPVAVEGEGVELRTQKVGETTVAFVTLEEGTDLSPATKGLPDDLCPCPHWGYMLKGRLAMTT